MISVLQGSAQSKECWGILKWPPNTFFLRKIIPYKTSVALVAQLIAITFWQINCQEFSVEPTVHLILSFCSSVLTPTIMSRLPCQTFNVVVQRQKFRREEKKIKQRHVDVLLGLQVSIIDWYLHGLKFHSIRLMQTKESTMNPIQLKIKHCFRKRSNRRELR